MKIMFICTGNICRSAMAHWLFKHKIEKINIKNIEIYSSGINAFTGDTPTEEAVEVMEEYGVDLKKHKATNMIESNIREMDLILCATNIHKMQVVGRFPQLREKTFTLKEYVNYNEKDEDSINIKDPWGYNIAIYRACAGEIEKCIDLLIEQLEKKN